MISKKIWRGVLEFFRDTELLLGGEHRLSLSEEDEEVAQGLGASRYLFMSHLC